MGSAARTSGRETASVVTAVRTDGVDRPTIDPSAEPTLSTTALVREAIDTALDSLDSLERQARDVARRFRRLSLDEGHLGLTHLVQSTQILLKLADMTAVATGVDLERVCEARGITALSDTNTAVGHLIRQQMAEDWSAVASVLDHAFLRALGGWRLVFEALGGPTYGTAA
jgi:hypothetical protein